MTGGTSGAQTMKGVAIALAGADTNIGLDVQVPDGQDHVILRSSTDIGDYFAISTTAHGATTVRTNVNAGNDNADLTFTVHGDIILGPSDGDVLPDSDNTRNLGSLTKRWANIYTGDLHLKNDRGDWTVIEEEEYLSLRNNKSGKLYRLVMEEVQ